MSNKFNFKLLNILVIMLILYIGVSTVGVWGGIVLKILSILSPFLIAFAVAYAFHPFVKFLEKKGVRKNLAVAIVVILVLLFVAGILCVTLPLVYDQLILFSRMFVEAIQDFASKFDLNLGELQGSVSNFFTKAIESIGQVISDGTIDILGKSINIITQAVVIVIASIYFLSYMDKIRSATASFLKSLKGRIFSYFKVLDKELSNYVKGMVIIMIIQVFEYSIVFRLVGHPNWLLLGVLASVTTLVPYVGGVATNIVAIITASVVSTPVFIGTIIAALILPQIDGYLITPKVYGKTNNINPLWCIFAITVGGTIGGLWGILVAVPIFIVLSSTYKFFRKDIKKGVDKVKDEIKA